MVRKKFPHAALVVAASVTVTAGCSVTESTASSNEPLASVRSAQELAAQEPPSPAPSDPQTEAPAAPSAEAPAAPGTQVPSESPAEAPGDTRAETAAGGEGQAAPTQTENDGAGPAITWVSVPTTITAGSSFTATFSVIDQNRISPQSVNVTIGGSSGFVTTWCGFSILASLVSGDTADGVWSISCQVPANAVNGSYTLSAHAQDSYANSTARASAFTVVGGTSDDQAPAISGVTAPAQVAPGSRITFTWNAADASGVDYALVWVANSTGFASTAGVPVVDYGDYTSRRTSGSERAGAYTQSVTLPATAEPGTYSVWISTADTLGNKTFEQYGTFTVDR